jgi:hypothetical protein
MRFLVNQHGCALIQPCPINNGMATLRENMDLIDRLQSVDESDVAESAPPGKEAEEWIKANKARFRKEYGDDYGKYLYGHAWQMFGNKR